MEASTRRARRRGLAGLSDLPPQLALHIPHSWSVHTVGMRFGLDLVWLDRGGEVVRVDGGVGPRRLKACLRARSVIEINAGQADRFLAAGLSPGDDSHGISPT